MNAIAILRHGQVAFTQEKGQVSVRLQLKGLQAFAAHAIHIHEYGDLSRGCKSLGGHYNPTGQPHGKHAGDLLFNLQADEKGVCQQTFATSAFRVRDVLGRAVVIHQLVDDKGAGAKLYKYMNLPDLQSLCKKNRYPARTRSQCLKHLLDGSKTTGNSGPRMDCGIIGRAA